jgi:hypothetical protein
MLNSAAKTANSIAALEAMSKSQQETMDSMTSTLQTISHDIAGLKAEFAVKLSVDDKAKILELETKLKNRTPEANKVRNMELQLGKRSIYLALLILIVLVATDIYNEVVLDKFITTIPSILLLIPLLSIVVALYIKYLNRTS